MSTVVIVAPNEVRTDVLQVTMPGNDRLQDVVDINWSVRNIVSNISFHTFLPWINSLLIDVSIVQGSSLLGVVHTTFVLS